MVLLLLAVLLQTGASLLLGAGHTHATAPPGGSPCTIPADVAEIAPGAFVRKGETALPNASNRGGIANIGFIVGGESVAVIDTGGSHCDGQRLREAIRARTALPIRFIVNTHVHPDHIFGNSAFTGAGAAILAHRHLPRALAERAAHYMRSYEEQIGAGGMAGTKPMAPDRLVEDRMEIDLGKRFLVIEAHKAAHTDQDLTVYDPSTGTLWTGDLVFLDHIPVLDGSLKGWLAATRELMRHEARQIVPGHGPAVAPWPEAAKNQLYYLERLEADLRQSIRAGENIGEAAGKAAASESARWQLFESFNSRNAIAGFAELEWD